jgi:biotin/methionine sulfoxide reductase
MCARRNPNVLTTDKGTSSPGPGLNTGHRVLVEIERWNASVPEITAYTPPPMEQRDGIQTSPRLT